MNRKNSKESGFATIFILMLAVALFILLGFVVKNMYSIHKENKKSRQELKQEVNKLNNKKMAIDSINKQTDQ
jgi:Na+/melibiose symporter-like transporter